MFFFLLYFSVRNNTLGSYKGFFSLYLIPVYFWLDFENRSANLEQIRKKTGNQKREYYSNRNQSLQMA